LSIIEEEVMPSVYRTQILEFVRGAKRGLMKGFRAMNGTSKVAEVAL
jgi:hypothetical protein